jgi:hypothetical protein
VPRPFRDVVSGPSANQRAAHSRSTRRRIDVHGSSMVGERGGCVPLWRTRKPPGCRSAQDVLDPGEPEDCMR